MSPRFFVKLLGVLAVLLTGVSAHAVGPRRTTQRIFRLAAATGDTVQVININNNWVEADPVGGMLYVSLGSNVPNGNSILRVDPTTMGTNLSGFVGSEPGISTISDDGQYLYTFLNGSAQMRRIHLPDLTPGLQFPLGVDGLGPWRAEDLEVLPGQPNALLATMYHAGFSPRSAGTAIYDNGVRRPNMDGWGNRHTCDPSGQKAYIFHNESTGAGTWEVTLGPNGVDRVPNGANGSNLLTGFGIDGKLYNGLIYANNGAVFQPGPNLLLGTYTGGTGIPVVDSTLNRVYFLTGWGSETQIKVFDRSNFLQVGSIPIPGVEGGATGLVSCADGGFAFRTATQVFVLHTGFRPSKPQPPNNLTATIQPGGKAALGWTDNSPSEDGFRIERATQGASFAEIATVQAGATTFTDAGLAPSTTYAYRVRAYNVAGSSGYSNTASVLTPPPPPASPTAPLNLTATALSYAQISLSWQDTSNVEESFEIERKSGGGSFVPLAVVGPNQGSYSDAGVTEQTSYTYRVRATNLGGTSDYSNEASAATPAGPTAAPSLLTAGAVSNSEIRLAWRDNSSNETLFKVERKTGAGSFAPVGTAPARAGTGGAVTYADTAGLAPGTTYTYQVRAAGPLGDSPNSNPASANTVPIAPLAPSGLTVVVTSPSTIALSWLDNSANETGFKIDRKSGAGSFSYIGQVVADTTVFPDAGLSSDTVYTYRVRATNSAGDSANSAEAGAATAPNAPSALGAVAFGPGQIKLTWTDTSSTETGFKIERKSGGSFAPLTAVAAGVTTYTDSELTPHSTYLYRVRSTNGGGDSAPTAESSGLTLPAAPSQLVVAPVSATQLELTWTDNNPSPPAIKIERSTNGGAFAMVGTSAVGTTRFRDSGLAAITTYTYRVRATNASGDSGYSVDASSSTLPTPPAAPSGLTAIAQGSTAILLTWQDNSSNESGFEVARLAPIGGGYQLVSRTGSNTTTFTDTGVNGSTTYSYRVRAVNAGGTSSYTAIMTLTTPADLPTPPNNLTATALSSTQIRLTWIDLTDAETGYRVERKAAGGTYQVLTTTNANVIEYVDTGLTEGTAYTYQVTALGSSGNSPASGEVNATTLLGAPSSLVATAAANRVNLAWQDGSTHETGFQIERKAAGGSFTNLASVSANVTAYADTAVTANSTYTYRIKATGSAGGSSYTNESSAAPLNVTPLAKLVVAPTKVSFGTVRVGANKLKTVKLTNKGKEPLSATVGLVGAPFAVVSGGGSVTLLPKQSLTVTLRYAPTAAGTATAAVRITSTVPATPQVDVALSGKGK